MATAILIAALLALLALLYLGWGALRQVISTRSCPRCGRSVTVGVLDCPHCEFDFRTIGA